MNVFKMLFVVQCKMMGLSDLQCLSVVTLCNFFREGDGGVYDIPPCVHYLFT